MECGQCFPSQSFLVLTVDEFIGHSGGPLERQKQDSHVYRKTSTESSAHKRRSLRNCEKGMEFLTCDGCEDIQQVTM